MKNIIKRNKIKIRFTGLVLMNIEKAFDTIWYNGLIFKLFKFKFPIYLIKIIKSFLADRKFLVAIGNSKSCIKNIIAGLPQRSVLSPILYSIFISDFKKPSVNGKSS